MPVSLAERLKELIQREGPITFHDWMKAALYDPHGGYYQRTDIERWGRAGDYRTSPERSELFAPSFARYFAKLFDELERPVDWTIVEGGAGDGRFAAGVMQTLADQFPGVYDATRYLVYDASRDALRRAQARLREFEPRVELSSGVELSRIERGIYFSNELLDAFPVHRVVETREGLSELYVTVGSDGNFAWSTGELSTERLSEFVSDYSLQLSHGQMIEINLAVDDWMTQAAGKLDQGFLITVDYGAEAEDLYDPTRRPKGTLRAFSRHGFVEDLLAQPGDYDITANVNWTQIKTVGERVGFKLVEFASQDKFLLQAGLLEEMEQRLTRAQTEAEKLMLTTGVREMILPGGMGASFQVMVQRRVEKGVADVESV